MTQDVVALLTRAPRVRDVVAAMQAAGERFRVRSVADGAVVQLLDDDDRPLVSIEVPVLVQIPGEVERLLGADVAAQVPPPLWWVEARAPSARAHAERLARRFADALAARCGGVVWAAEPAAPPVPGPPAEPAAAPRGEAGAEPGGGADEGSGTGAGAT
jgi:hypothetical protein